MEIETGQLLNGKYRIVRRIGVGGMASVYEAQHMGLGTAVAIKVLLSELARAPTLADRFRREARVSATLDSPHVIDVMDVDQLPDGRPYLVMELLRGESLEQRLASEKLIGLEPAVDIALQILLGLECAHERGVVHRDLKPGNVFLAQSRAAAHEPGALIKLLDFGIAKVRASSEFQSLTRPGMVLGTPEYMAPEQAFSADQASTQSDLYSVGVMLYEMLSGALPACGEIPIAVAQQVLTGQVEPLDRRCPGLPPGLVEVVHRALSPNPRQRPESALALRRELAAFAGRLSPAGQRAAIVPAPEASAPLPVAEHTELMAASPARSSVPASSAARGPLPTLPLSPAGGTAAVLSALQPAAILLPREKEGPDAHSLAASKPAAQKPTPAPRAPAPAHTRRRRSVLLWLTLCGVLLGAGAGAVWALQAWQLFSDPGPPPPLPRLQSVGGIVETSAGR